MMENNQEPSLPMEELDQEIDKLIASAPPMLPTPFENACEFIGNRSVTFKLFRNEFSQPAFTSAKNNKKLKRMAQELLQPDQPTKRSATYFVPLPRNRSRFTIQEMNDLYAVYTASSATEVATNSQILTYSKSLGNIKAENDEYLQHIKRRWLEESWSRVNVIKEEVTLFVSTWWEARLSRVKRYAEMYSRLSSIPLAPSEIEGKLTFLKTLVKYGKPTRYYSSVHSKSPYSLSLVHGELLKAERDKVKQQNKSLFTDINKEVTDDKLAESYAVDHHVQIVTTPSVLVALVANTPGTFEEAWCIPFQIKVFNSGDQNRKIIFMDKKLPPKALTISEKNAIFSKAAVKAIFRKSKNSLAQINSNDAGQYFRESDEDEEFDEMSSPSFVEKDDVLVSSKKRAMREEVSYDLWEYSAAEEHSALSKHHRKPFKLLLKTTTKGKNFDFQRRLLPCVMTCKLDYQPEYGASVMSFRELMRDWLSLQLHPDSILHRVRVDPIKGDAFMVECKTATTVANECVRLYSRCVRQQLSVIQSLFDQVSQLPPGNYLLNHDPKDKGFMYVYHEQQDKQKRAITNLNIWEDYSKIDTTRHAEQLAPWIGIDPTVLTPTLHNLKWIPCVFPPVKNEANKKKLPEDKKVQPKKKKKKKNKTKTGPKKSEEEKSTNGNTPRETLRQTQPSVDASRGLVSYDGVFG